MSADDLRKGREEEEQPADSVEGEGYPEFDVEEQFDEPSIEELKGPDYAPQYYKARPYNLGGAKYPGKWHAVRYRSDTEVCTVAACGMKLDGCPGDLVTATPELEVNCKSCIAALKKLSWWHDVIDWRLSWYDGDEDRWAGFVQGEELYGIHRGSWYALYDDSAGDSCDSLIEGFEACHQHLLNRLQAAPKRRYW